MSLRAYVHASEVLTGAGIRVKDGIRPTEDDLERIEDGAVVYSVQGTGKKALPRRIEWVGPTGSLPKKFARVPKTDLKRRRAVIPGLVDSHTHLVFAGDRAAEFAMRCAGATYQEIAAQGGGIQTTVNATRDATAAELEAIASERVREAYRWGVRTIEAKSGYGLTTESEVRILEVVQRLAKKFPEMTFVPTFLGAHAFPKEKNREAYLREILDEMLPAVARKKLARFCDVFVDEGYFTRDEGRTILEKARALGLSLKMHADELENTESAALAAQLKAHSADHLLRVSDGSIRDLAASTTVAVLLPGTAFYLKAPQAPARRLIDSGARVALATDFNPGTCMTLSLPAIMTIAALYLKMSRAEIFAAVTYNAAKAVGLESKKGTIESGKDADLTVLPFARFEELYYRFAWAPPFTDGA